MSAELDEGFRVMRTLTCNSLCAGRNCTVLLILSRPEKLGEWQATAISGNDILSRLAISSGVVILLKYVAVSYTHLTLPTICSV